MCIRDRARALATNPQILLMDEAFSALDPLIRSDMQSQLLELQSQLKKTIVFITHDLDESLKLGDHIGILNGGRLVQVGKPEDILLNPADDYVASFVGDVNRARVLKAKSVMVEKNDSHNGMQVAHKANSNDTLEELIPIILGTRALIEVVDDSGNSIGYISDAEASKFLSKD